MENPCAYIWLAQTPPTPSEAKQKQHYLPLALSFQVYHTHINNGPKVGEGLHGHHVGALLVAVHVEL